MKSKAKSRVTNHKFIFYPVIIILLIVLTLVCLDFINYRSGNRSRFFGTLDNYQQSQVLKFNNLDLKVTKLTLKSYPKPTPPARKNCTGLSYTNPLLHSSFSTGHLPDLGSPYSDCQDKLDYYNNSLRLYLHQNAATVYFDYSNIGTKPLDLSFYKAKMLANTNLDEANNGDYPKLHPNCSGLPKSQILKGGEQTSCFTFDINKSYHGPLELIVTSSNKEKQVNIQI